MVMQCWGRLHSSYSESWNWKEPNMTDIKLVLSLEPRISIDLLLGNSPMLSEFLHFFQLIFLSIGGEESQS